MAIVAAMPNAVKRQDIAPVTAGIRGRHLVDAINFHGTRPPAIRHDAVFTGRMADGDGFGSLRKQIDDRRTAKRESRCIERSFQRRPGSLQIDKDIERSLLARKLGAWRKGQIHEQEFFRESEKFGEDTEAEMRALLIGQQTFLL